MKKRYDVIKYLTKKGAEINHVDHVSIVLKMANVDSRS